MSQKLLFIILALTSLSSLAGDHFSNKSTTCAIAENGKSCHEIITAANADAEVKKAAEYLSFYLGKMTGAEFAVKAGDGENGIAVGTVNDFPLIKFKPHFKCDDPGERQGYEIKSHTNGIYIIGATPKAVSYAVFDLLQRLGYRRYFPMRKWEIIPSQKTLSFALHIRETPDYYSRRIWPHYGIWKEHKASLAEWDKVNRNGGYGLNSGHAYEFILRRNKEIFNKHPEYLGLVNGKRKSTKFCISNPELRKLIADFIIKRFEQNPTADSMSVDPSDGGGWCECAECKKVGSPSTRAVLLANEVAKTVRQKFKGKRIGMYAYNYHSAPPAIDVDKDVVISAATAFIKGGLSIYQIMDSWKQKKAVMGIRDYYDVYCWSRNAPGAARGGNLNYLKTSIPEFYKQGVRYMSSEASDGWGPNGLGQYLAEKMLWNIKESKNIDALQEDFLQKCFGPSAETMKKFYKLLDGSTRSPLSTDLLGRMYRLLEKARQEAVAKPDILGRLDELALYTRYCELLYSFNVAPSAKKKIAAFQKLGNFAAATRYTRMVHTRPIFRHQLLRVIPRGRKLKPRPELDWKTIKHYTQEEINTLIKGGIAKNKLLDFKPLEFSDNLKPAQVINRQKMPSGKINARRGLRAYYIWVDKNLKPIKLSVTGGLIKHYRNRGNVKIKLLQIGGTSQEGTRETIIQEDSSVPPNGKTHSVILNPKQPGLHKIIISDGMDRTSVKWPAGLPRTIRSFGTKPQALKVNIAYFYVPVGTKTIGFYGKLSRVTILSPKGKKMLQLNKFSGFKSIPIPEGMDGKLWRFKRLAGAIGLMTVPPYLALNPAALLLPEEVIAQDKLNIK